MRDSLKYIFALIVSCIMIVSCITTIPYILVVCVGLYSLYLTIVSMIADKTDNVLKIGYGVSSIICLVGSLYGYIMNEYLLMCIGPIILVLVYIYHRNTYG